MLLDAGDAPAAQRLDTVLWTLAECLRLLAVLLAPFLPTTSERIRAQLGLAGPTGCWEDETRWGQLAAGGAIGDAVPIFPQIEEPRS